MYKLDYNLFHLLIFVFMKKAIFLVLAILSIFLSNGQTINTDRPTQGASALVLPKGSFQIEAGFIGALTTIKKLKGLKETQLTIPTTTFRYAVLKNVEIRLSAAIIDFKTNFPQINNSSDDTYTSNFNRGIAYYDKIRLGLKFQLLNLDNRRLKLGWLTNFILPNGTVPFNNSLGINNRLLISHTIGDAVSLGYNLGHTYYEKGFHQVFLSISGTFKLNDQFGFFIEPYINSNEDLEDKTIDHLANINSGVTFLARNNLQFDLSIGSNLNIENELFFEHTRFISAGVSWLIQKKQ